jgi:hypothetical protein
MGLPDQLTVEELEEKIASYKERLENLPGREDGPALQEVNGGEIIEGAQGAARVHAAGETLHTVPGFIPHVELVYRFPGGSGSILLETTPARLLKVGSTWQNDRLTQAGWSERHATNVSSMTERFTFQVPSAEMAIARPRRADESRGDETATQKYEVPPAATHIRGEGTLIYPTGQELTVRGEQLLKRPGPGGELVVRPGGVYAIFEGPEPAEAKLGNRWIPTIPTR